MHLLKELMFCFSEVFKLCEAENIDFVEYFVTDKHFFEQIFRKVEPESFLYEFLNNGDPLHPPHSCNTFLFACATSTRRRVSSIYI